MDTFLKLDKQGATIHCIVPIENYHNQADNKGDQPLFFVSVNVRQPYYTQQLPSVSVVETKL